MKITLYMRSGQHEVELVDLESPQVIPSPQDDIAPMIVNNLEHVMELMLDSIKAMTSFQDPDPETEIETIDRMEQEQDPDHGKAAPPGYVYNTCILCGNFPQLWDQKRVNCRTENCPNFGKIMFSDEWDKANKPKEVEPEPTSPEKAITKLKELFIDYVGCGHCPVHKGCLQSDINEDHVNCKEMKKAWLTMELAKEL